MNRPAWGLTNPPSILIRAIFEYVSLGGIELLSIADLLTNFTIRDILLLFIANNISMIADDLEKFGLTEKESKTFLCLARLGSQPASKISEYSGVNRSTTYIILSQLLKKGLVRVTTKLGIKNYSISRPEIFLERIESSIRKYAELNKVARKIKTELESLHSYEKINYDYIEGRENIMELISSQRDPLIMLGHKNTSKPKTQKDNWANEAGIEINICKENCIFYDKEHEAALVIKNTLISKTLLDQLKKR
jgi:DNA-binding MarR family transcriptional regulator